VGRGRRFGNSALGGFVAVYGILEKGLGLNDDVQERRKKEGERTRNL